MNCEVTEKRQRGRPRGFDREEALDRAVEVFWREGYDGATVAELCRATGLNPPSLYAAFGDKARLFEAALDRYQATTGGFAARVLMDAPTAQAAVRGLLEAAADALATPGRPCGCLVVTGALTCADKTAREAGASRRALSYAAIHDRIARGASAGELPLGEDVDALTRFVVSVFQGMGVQARDGATPEQLRAVAQRAMAAWPRRAQD
jgi:AcrR family transcriptional regulator